jgi:hypothetical protein
LAKQGGNGEMKKLDKGTKKILHLKISGILNKNCFNCENFQKSGSYCVDCPFYKELRSYGRILYQPKREEKEPKKVVSETLTKELLLKHLEEGMTKSDIEIMYGLTRNYVYALMKKWGVEHKAKRTKQVISKELYLEERNNGLTDYRIRSKHNVSWRTLQRNIKVWELENYVPTWVKPEIFTPEVYQQLKGLGYKNSEIEKMYNMNRRERERILNTEGMM